MIATPATQHDRSLGRFRLGDVLGVGGMSTVYAGADPNEPGRRLAVKTLRLPEGSSEAKFVARFRREAQAAMTLRHERILPVLDYGEADGVPYMVLPLMEGGTLAARLAAHPGPLPLDEAARYAREVAAALDFAHAHGVVHRDVKPGNVLLDERGGAHLADFGIARLYDSDTETLDWTQLTTDGEVIGTPSYMAPEQFQGADVGPAADVYALGVMLYLLVTGRLPFAGETPVVIGLRHLREEPLAPGLLRPELPAAANVAILWALRKAPAQRCASAGALAEAFAQGVQGRWTAANPPEGVWIGGDDRTVGEPMAFAATAAGRRDSGRAWRRAAARRISWPPVWARMRAPRVVVGLALALLLLFGLALAAHGLAGRTVTAATATETAPAAPPTATVAPHATTTVAFEGTRVFGRGADGAVLWTYRVSGKDGRIVAVSEIQQDMVYVSTDKGIVYALRASDGTVISRSQPDQGGGDGGD